nr:reverse transcriptase domain-containing protein [Tanacetum cinerariifolium]
MAEMLRAPAEGCAEAIVVPLILAEQFELKHSLINMMTLEQFFGLEKENPHDHIRWGSPPVARKRTPRIPLPLGMILWQFVGKIPQDALTIIKNKSKVRSSQSKPITSSVNACDINSSSEIAKLTHAVNQQMSAVTTVMTVMLKQLQANPPLAPVKAVEEICVTFGGSGSLPGNTVANPKGELKAITTRSGLVTDGPTVPTPPKSVTPEEDECVEETYTDPDLAEYTIKVPPPPVQKHKPLFQRNIVVHTRDFPLPNISELKCKALADLGAIINLMPLSVWKELGLPDLIPNRITLELANRAICTPNGIARDVFVPVGKFTFPADFILFNYESDPIVPLILGRPFLRNARALIDVYGEEMILCDGDERLTLNMKHDTASYANHPHRESVNLINIFNVTSKDCLEVSVLNPISGNPTFSLHKEITSPEVTHEIHDSERCKFLSKELPDIDSFNDIHPYFNDNPLSGGSTYSSNSLLEEFTDELARITYPPNYDDNLQFDIESDLKEIEFLLYQVESDAGNVYDDPFDSKGEKIKESKLLNDELDLPCDFLPYSEYDSFNSQDFSRDDDLPSPNNEDKDFDPPFYEPLVFKDVPKSMRLLLFSSENEEKVFKPEIYTSEKVKGKQEKDKIESKPDKNRKRAEARESQRPITVKKEERKKKIQVQGTKYTNPRSCMHRRLKEKG